MVKSKHSIHADCTSQCSTVPAGAKSILLGEDDVFVSDIAHETSTFFALYSEGRATAEQVDDFVDAWHESGDEETRPLSEYLGMTEEEYGVWVITPRALPAILAARRAKRPLRDFVAPLFERLRSAGDPNDRPVLHAMGY
jgi:hypothetical protein